MTIHAMALQTRWSFPDVCSGRRRLWSGSILVLVFAVSVLATDAAGQRQVPIDGTGAPISLADALKSTLQAHPALQIQKWEVESGRGAQREAAGQFDTLLGSSLAEQSADLPLTVLEQSQFPSAFRKPDALNTVTAYDFNVSKLFRSGISVSSFMNLNRNSDNLLNQAGNSTSAVGLQMIFPLLNGRGRSVTGAAEAAASMEVGSRRLDLQQTTQRLLANTAVSYWELVAANRQLAVEQASEERGKLLLETVKALIDADRVPKNDIHQVTANFADRVANRIAGEQTLSQARQQLGLDMGLSPGDLWRVGDPSDSFPEVTATIDPLPQDVIRAYVQQAMQNRPDLEAAQRREVQARTLLRAAQGLTAPQVDFKVTTGYSQLLENGVFSSFFSSLFANTHRPDFQAGIYYQFARSNNVANGRLLRAQAALHEAELQRLELQRQISAAVSLAVDNLRYSVARVKSAREAVEAFQKSLEGEKAKFSLGQSSLTEILTVEDRLTTAMSRQVDAELSYALALTGLRLATGTLVPASGEHEIDVTLFQSVPPRDRDAPR